jgi:hypothetical protein
MSSDIIWFDEAAARLGKASAKAIHDIYYRNRSALPPAIKVVGRRGFHKDDWDEWINRLRDEARVENQERLDAMNGKSSRTKATPTSNQRVAFTVSPDPKTPRAKKRIGSPSSKNPILISASYPLEQEII